MQDTLGAKGKVWRSGVAGGAGNNACTIAAYVVRTGNMHGLVDGHLHVLRAAQFLRPPEKWPHGI